MDVALVIGTPRFPIGCWCNGEVVGISLFMGGDYHVQPSGRKERQTTGSRLRIGSAEFHRGGALMRLLPRYTQALITQVCQTDL